MTPLEAKKRWPLILAQSRTAEESDKAFSIGLASSFTADPLVPFLGVSLADMNIEAPRITVGPYNQIFQVCFDWRSAFPDQQLNALLLLWRVEDLVGLEFNKFLMGDVNALNGALAKLDELAHALAELRRVFTGTIIVSLPPFPHGGQSDLRSLGNYAETGAFHRAITNAWLEHIDKVGGISVLDLDGLQRYFGAEQSTDPRKWHLYKQPYKEEFWVLIGETLARLIASQRDASKKAIVLDCDGTLWGGIIGEDGLDGIEIGEDFPGSAYQDFQRQLIVLQSKGVMLALCSKNNEADVWEVFDRHDGMLLKREHISAWRINWSHKAENIAGIAQDLNIGTDSLVFIDDNPFEISQVQELLPQVDCIQVPDDASRLPTHFGACRLFDKEHITSEDRQRTNMMAQERDRRDLAKNLSTGDFLQSLGLIIDVFKVDDEHCSRVAQLINKTNQFNLTTIRRTVDEVRVLCNDPKWEVLAFRVSDRFGDYGVVGVVLMQEAGDILNIDTLLMSCRVLGRGVEQAIFSVIADSARTRSISRLRGEYQPTNKNSLVADLYAKHGFESIAPNTWEALITNISAWPDHMMRA